MYMVSGKIFIFFHCFFNPFHKQVYTIKWFVSVSKIENMTREKEHDFVPFHSRQVKVSCGMEIERKGCVSLGWRQAHLPHRYGE